jgi:transposase
MLTNAQWAMLEPLIEACRPNGKTAPQDLRRIMSAVLWRHQNGAKWRSVPAQLVPGQERPRPPSAGYVWASGSASLDCLRRRACNSG